MSNDEPFRQYYSGQDRQWLKNLCIGDQIVEDGILGPHEPIGKPAYLQEKFVSDLKGKALWAMLFDLDDVIREAAVTEQQLFRSEYLHILFTLSEKGCALMKDYAGSEPLSRLGVDVSTVVENEIAIQQRRFDDAPWRLVRREEYELFTKRLMERLPEEEADRWRSRRKEGSKVFYSG